MCIPTFVGLLALGFAHSLVVKHDGSVWGTGSNQQGQLGTSNTRELKFTILIISGAKAVAAGKGHSLVLKQDGTLWAAGQNDMGQLGDGSKVKFETFKPVGQNGVQAIAAAIHHSVILKQDGSVWTCGEDIRGMGTMGTFVEVMARDATAVATGVYHTLVMKRDGSVQSTGCNDRGQLGSGIATCNDADSCSSKCSSSDFGNAISKDAKAVAANGRHSLVLKVDGRLWGAGWGAYGQLGDGSKTKATTVFKELTADVQSMAAGRYHSLVLKQDGRVLAAGRNADGQLGDNTKGDSNGNRKKFQLVSSDAFAVAAGFKHSMILKRDGTLWATGYNGQGQLGTDSKKEQKEYIEVLTDVNYGEWFAVWLSPFPHSTIATLDRRPT